MAKGKLRPGPKAGRYDRWTAARRKIFLTVLAESGNVRHAADSAGMDRSGAYLLRDRDPRFAAQWAEALEQTVDDLYAMLLDRVRNGSTRTERCGDKVKTIHSYSNGLAMMILGRYRPTLHRRVADLRKAKPPRKAPDEAAIAANVARILRGSG